MDKYTFDIDVVGACNLRCPSCPQGNIREYQLPQGFMAPDLLLRIMEKAQRECAVPRVCLFSWTEPLLHPQLPELVRIIRRFGPECYLSSNLNFLPGADALMAANPDTFRVSVSGFTQEIYGYSHRRGDIEQVKRNLAELVAAKERNGAGTRIHIYYHRYRHNLKEEPLFRAFAAELGVAFEAVWAQFFPLEKVLSTVDDDPSFFRCTDEDRELLNHLVLPLNRALEISRRYADTPCTLREKHINIDFRGNVLLCCGIYDAGKYAIGSYLNLPLAEIQARRHSHSLCVRCMPQGGHVYLTQEAPELAESAAAIAQEGELRRDLAAPGAKMSETVPTPVMIVAKHPAVNLVEPQA